MAEWDLSHHHPEMVVRNNALEALVVEAGGTFGITSTWRPKERDGEPPLSQRYFWNEYKRGGNEAANPDAVQGTSPWHWPVIGSWHMIQQDGWAHALDYAVAASGLSDATWQRLGAMVGLRRTVSSEIWHYQWCSIAGGIFEPTAPWFLDGFRPKILVPQAVKKKKQVQMIVLVCIDDPARAEFILGAGTICWIASGTLPPIYAAADVPRVEVNTGQVIDILRTHHPIGMAPNEGNFTNYWQAA